MKTIKEYKLTPNAVVRVSKGMVKYYVHTVVNGTFGKPKTCDSLESAEKYVKGLIPKSV